MELMQIFEIYNHIYAKNNDHFLRGSPPPFPKREPVLGGTPPGLT
jgi:hypothetical protein